MAVAVDQTGKDGFAFEPVDRVLPLATDDVKELDFVGTAKIKP